MGWLKQIFSRHRRYNEIAESIQEHIEEKIEDLMEDGLSREEATRKALLEFGNVTLIEERSREVWQWPRLETLFQDLRFGARMLLKKPAFTLIVVTTLGLSIGANVAIFSFVDTFFLRPLPVRDPERLINVYGGFAYPDYAHYREHSKSLETLAAHYSTSNLNLMIDGDSSMVIGAVVSANYFPMLGIQPRLGRFFLPEEDAVPDRNPVVVISERMWQGRFKGDPKTLGKQLKLNGVAFQIIGVAPAEFPGVLPGNWNEVWLPTMMLRVGYPACDALADCRMLSFLGRLTPGQTLTEAEAELNLLARQLAVNFPTEQTRVIRLHRALGIRMGPERPAYAYQMQLLMGVTGLLLVIACANVAGLLLMRASARRKEIAIRLCIGAGRGRLVRQFLTESLLLACAGGAVGLVLSRWATELLAAYYNSSSWQYDLSLSPRVVIYGLALTLFTGILFGVWPALKAPSYDLARGLKDDGCSQHTIHQRSRSALVVGQVALSLAMLVVAGLLIRSELHVRAGAFDSQNVVALRLRPGLVRYRPEHAQAFTREVVRRLETTPGVQSVGVAAGSGGAWGGTGHIRVRLPEQTAQRLEDQLRVEYQESGPRLCETLKIPLLAGREFNEGDRPGSPRVVVINETLARRLWPADTALQQTLFVNDQPYQVVGVSKDARLRNMLEGPLPFLYLPYWQNNLRPHVDARMLIRVAGDPRTMLPQLRRTIVGVDPQVPLSEIGLLTDQVDAHYNHVMLTSTVVTYTGALAFLLSMLGLYGVLAFAVSQRSREIGIRMALGAERSDVLRLVIAQGLRLALAGVGIGLLAAYAATRLVKSLLYGVSATDAPTFIVIALLLLVVALLACWIPARRATKVDPLLALRCD
jgi:predicted permease